jgi:hypothetical protein
MFSLSGTCTVVRVRVCACVCVCVDMLTVHTPLFVKINSQFDYYSLTRTKG